MTARRTLVGLALLTAAVGAACAQVVPGTGIIAADARAGSGPTGSASPSSSPSSGDSTGSSSSAPTSPSPSGSGGTSPVCQALDKGAVEDAFRTSVTFNRSQSSGCQIRADDGRSMIVAVFDYLTLSEYRKADSTELKVGGHPAIRTSTTIIYVGRSKDPDAEGLLAAYYSGLRDGGDAVAVKVLELLILRYAK